MHNCKLSSSELINLALDAVPLESRQRLLNELRECALCREEFAAIRNLLRLTDHSFATALPDESFWTGYHSRLRRRLVDSTTSKPVPQSASFSSSREFLKRIISSSIKVPVPVAAALFLILIAAIGFAVQRHTTPKGPREVVSTVTKTIEVPVVKEKTVRQVVYIARPVRTVRPAQQLARTNTIDRPLASSLVGFKPTEHVKLTVIKGSYRDEK
jgi:hypothetical protein